MSQKFPDIESTDYIDVGILDLQDRDNAVLTMFCGLSEPDNPFQDLLWNDLTNLCIKRYNDNAWEIIIDYRTTYISEVKLRNGFQPLNSNLTAYSSTEVSGVGFINNSWVNVSSFFINSLSQEVSNNIGLKNLAFKSKLTQNNINDRSISVTQLSTSVETNPPYKIGDSIPSFNSGTKKGCVKLSTRTSITYTVGAVASNSTYNGNTYKNLYQFVWSNLNLPIYTSSGVSTNKGSNWEEDWNNNKKLELPHIKLPIEDNPSNYTLLYSSVDGNRSNENLDTDTQYNSQRTIWGTINIPKNGYYQVIVVGGGGGSSDRGDNWNGNGYGGAGAYFNGIMLIQKGTLNYEIGYGGRGCYGYARNHCAFDGSYSRLTGNNLYINCPGGYGGRCSRDSHVPSGISNRGSATSHYQGWTFAPEYSVNTGYLSVLAASSTGPRKDSWYGVYGKGGDTVGSTSGGNIGNNGFVSVVYIGPEEYGTTDSNVINSLNSLYSSLTYFMKY